MMPAAFDWSRCQNTMAPSPAANAASAAHAAASGHDVRVLSPTEPDSQRATPAPASAVATYGKVATRCARPSRSIKAGEAALPMPSNTMTRRNGSRSRVSRLPTATPGPNVKRNHPSRKRSGTGRNRRDRATPGHAQAPRNAPAVTRIGMDDGSALTRAALYRAVAPAIDVARFGLLNSAGA